jgi:hypothetical protein
MATYQILYWHDIPVQVRARGADGRANVQLPERFSAAVDDAAMAARQTDDDTYTEGFYWSQPQERAGTADAVAHAVAAELDAQFPEIDWRQTAATLRARQAKPPS